LVVVQSVFLVVISLSKNDTGKYVQQDRSVFHNRTKDQVEIPLAVDGIEIFEILVRG
jgi:hypothetical protein